MYQSITSSMTVDLIVKIESAEVLWSISHIQCVDLKQVEKFAFSVFVIIHETPIVIITYTITNIINTLCEQVNFFI